MPAWANIKILVKPIENFKEKRMIKNVKYPQKSLIKVRTKERSMYLVVKVIDNLSEKSFTGKLSTGVWLKWVK